MTMIASVTTRQLIRIVALVATSVSTIQAQALSRSPTQGVITTQQKVSPAGTQTAFDARVYGVGFGTSSDEVWVLVGAASGQPARRTDERSEEHTSELQSH